MTIRSFFSNYLNIIVYIILICYYIELRGDRVKEETKTFIKKYALLKLKYDFMGYPFNDIYDLSYHHLIIPKRLCGELGIGREYYEWNGAILVRNTAHPYLHIVEKLNKEMFYAISYEILEQKLKGYIDYENLKSIDDILNRFEKEHCSDTLKNSSKLLIKEEYTNRIVKQNKLVLKMK